MNSKQLFSILSSLMVISHLISGVLMDRFGRKKIIAIKASLTLLFMIPLIPLGFMSGSSKISGVLVFYFLAVLNSTFTFDLMLFGYEKLPKNDRENFIVAIASTRILGIAVICVIFYWTNKWVYFIILQVCLLSILIPLFLKYVFESPLYVMSRFADQDMCKFILNSIAVINEEEIVKEKIYFPINQ